MSLPESKIILYGAGKKRPETQPHLPRGAGNGADLLFRPVGRPGRRRSAENGRGQHDPQGSPGSPLRAEIHAHVTRRTAAGNSPRPSCLASGL